MLIGCVCLGSQEEREGADADVLRPSFQSPNGEFVLSSRWMLGNIHGYGMTLSYRHLVLEDKEGKRIWELTSTGRGNEILGPVIAINNAGDVALPLLRRANEGAAWDVHVQLIRREGGTIVTRSFGTPGWYFHGSNQFPGAFTADGKDLYLIDASDKPTLVRVTDKKEDRWERKIPFLNRPVQTVRVMFDPTDRYVACVEDHHDARPSRRFVVFRHTGEQIIAGHVPAGATLALMKGKLTIDKKKQRLWEIALPAEPVKDRPRPTTQQGAKP
ncbi:MAG: hypothetical protein CMJ49_01250 [Planctomycetaceae bacterium]|nr:hypothetical protein [Planctomycetaceae bacterium]